MIVFQVQGGLGNQLFQYATARRLALQHSCSLVIDPYWFEHPRTDETPRQLEFNHYPVVMSQATRREQMLWAPMRFRWTRFLQPLLPLHVVREHGFGVNPEVLSAPPNSYLIGFWQSEAYFADIRDQLLTELSPVVPPGPEDLQVIERMQHGNAVSVHVRRGDYVNLASAAAYHGLCTLDYYRKAIAYVVSHVENPSLFIFSDDHIWTKANLISPVPTYYVDHNSVCNAFQDLRLMSLCRHHILANSSFSWWGAWLSRSTDGLVIAPERWYAVARPTPDLIPSRWIRIAG